MNATQTEAEAGTDSTRGWQQTELPFPPHAAPAPAVAAAKSWTDLLLEAWASGHTLPLDSLARKLFPLASGFEAYFPAAVVAVSAHSYASNQKHNPGQSLRWSQDKST